RVVAVPARQEAELGGPVGAELAVPGLIVDGHAPARLVVAAAPELGDLLAAGEGPGHLPAGGGGATGVRHRDRALEATRPLVDHLVAGLAVARRRFGGRFGGRLGRRFRG